MNRELCSSCKTGADFLKLDPTEPFCYYITYCMNGDCKMYVPITPSVEKDETDKQNDITSLR